MSFKDLLIQAKDGSHYAQEKIFLLYRPLLFKEACVYEVFDEDLFQELSMTLVDCIRLFHGMDPAPGVCSLALDIRASSSSALARTRL